MNSPSGLPVASSTSRRKLVRERRGAMLVFIAVSMVVFLGFLSLTVDVGAGHRERRIAQTAADAGAIGGATEIYRLQSADSVRASALNEAVRNGYSAGQVTVNYPPATGPQAGNTQYVEVLISKSIPTIFGSFFNISSLNVASRAVAGVGSYGLNCIATLDQTADNSLNVANGSDLLGNCSISVNSSSARALNTNSSGELTGSAIAVTGDATGRGSVTPAAQTGAAAVPDPLASVVMPPLGTCVAHPVPTVIPGGVSVILTPGTYCGGLDISKAAATAILAPGTYIMKGGGLHVGQSGIIIGIGVTLITTIDPTNTYAYKPFIFEQGAKCNLTAPLSGSSLGIPGILLFQDPLAPPTPPNLFSCTNNTPIVGTFYFPNGSVTFNGSDVNTVIVGAVVAGTILVSGKINIRYDSSGNSAVKRISLVE